MNSGPDEHEQATFHVDVCSHQSHVDVKPSRLRRLAAGVLEAEGRDRATLSISVIDDAAIEPINRGYLDHEGATDVITFRLSGPAERSLDGEIVISAETAAREAAARGLDPERELALYLIHGLLHLCGHDDHDEADRRRMHARQDELLARLCMEFDAP